MRSLFDDQPVRAKTKIGVVYGLLVIANGLSWIWAWSAFHNRPALLGTAVVAYMLGLRHAFDADHIAAIDNVVRKLIQEGKHPFSVGFFFSLGHSSIVVLGSLAIAAASTTQGRLYLFRDVGGVTGTSISALFLLVIGFANVLILRGIWAAFSRARRGETIVDEDLEALLAGRSLLARVFRRTFKVVSRSWHMYPIGFLFGLGFDTASEIALLGISATQAAQGMSLWTILVFPALFTAGMSLMDTTDSTLMTRAYGWALANPIRKLWYNLTITSISVIVAIFVGSLEALGVISDRYRLQGGLWEMVATFNENLASLGFALVGLFIVSWIISTMIYRAKGYDRVQVNAL